MATSTETTTEKDVAEKRPRNLAKRKNTDKWGYFFVAPFFVFFLIFNFYPMFYTIYLSFTDLAGWATEANFVGLQNYTTLLNNQLYRNSVVNTFILWVINFVPQIILAFLLAYWFTNRRLNLKGTGFFKSMFYLPNIITAASVALIFRSLFSYPRGPLNLIMLDWGLISTPVDFYRSVFSTRLIVSFIQFWMWYGQTSIVLQAGILGIDDSLFDAARVDGATDWQSFTKITMPLMKPITLYVLVTSLIGGLQIFDIPYLLTGGGPAQSVETMMIFIYKQAFQGGRNLNIASTASVFLLIMTAVISLFIFNSFRERSTKKGAR
ncbi:multiple sugar transport system permease protein [Alkalibacterium subtropicum]|uniref:Multiple sugar transport system permease protein n=1 Tax=Alkalibacterium subtropicum TaxID=753702 RepID=A0A1I1I0G8_9LACT|nr:sugar ABC transporter permease [Alkalibacterium subtropicum]SFC27173.1 multiple sugar transport system permease protein [Alkalibacterium subtropicum]